MARSRLKELRALIETAQGLGFECDDTSRRHLRFLRAGCTPVFVSRTPSCRRAWKNALSDLRHALNEQCPLEY
jgi:hypothetical protein